MKARNNMSKYKQLTELGIGATDLKNIQITLIKLVGIGELNIDSTALDIVKDITSLIDTLKHKDIERNKEINTKNK